MKVVKTRAYARAGLIGNPSDGYGGRTIAFTLNNHYAEVILQSASTLEIVPTPADLDQFDNVHALRDQVAQHGYYGGARLIKAAIKQFVDYCDKLGHALHHENFSIQYQSTIPQQVGMAGSSAIIIATLRALMQYYAVDIAQHLLPTIALNAERHELNIQGGLQDRVAQVYEGVVAMDFGNLLQQHGYDYGAYEALDRNALPPLYIAYKTASSEPTEVFHNDLRARFDSGDKAVIAAMQRFAELTLIATTAIKQRDYQTLHETIDANFDLRQSVCVLNPAHTEMIHTARACGASAKYAGSGGAIVGTYSDEQQYTELQQKLGALGCTLLQPEII
jgi:glucuronokinase